LRQRRKIPINTKEINDQMGRDDRKKKEQRRVEKKKRRDQERTWERRTNKMKHHSKQRDRTHQENKRPEEEKNMKSLADQSSIVFVFVFAQVSLLPPALLLHF
jgi:hypothetical protein